MNDISFHPSGNFLVSTSDDAFVKVWDLREGHQIFTLHAHQGAARAAAFSSDGKYFATGGSDQVALVWRAGAFVEGGSGADHVGNEVSQEVDVPPPLASRAQGGSAGHSGAPSEAPTATTSRTHVAREVRPEVSPAAPRPTLATRPASASAKPRDEIDAASEPTIWGEGADGTPPLPAHEAYAATMESVVSQMEMMRNTMGLLEERVTVNEDKMQILVDQQEKIIRLLTNKD